MVKTTEIRKSKETPGKPTRKRNDSELRLWASHMALYMQHKGMQAEKKELEIP
jgi:hypothetical protein